MEENFILMSDLYKDTHWFQYRPKTQSIKSYFENRGTTEQEPFDYNLLFGLQAYIKRYMEGPVIKQWMIEEAEQMFFESFGQNYFNKNGWQKIIDVYGGCLPLEIFAVPEGSIVPKRNVLFKQKNTDSELYWLTNFCEDILMNVWNPITIATFSYACKKLIDKKAIICGERVTEFHLNDFGMRGCKCPEDAALSGMGHLINFYGSDNALAISYLKKYYGGSQAKGLSVFATEHSKIGRAHV